MSAGMFDHAIGDLSDGGGRVLSGCDVGRPDPCHLAIVRSGVYVVSIASAPGLIDVQRDGWFTERRETLFVGSRDRTQWVGDAASAAAVVQDRLGDPSIPVHPVVATVEVEWPWLPRAYTVAGVKVVALPALRKSLVRPGSLAPDAIDRLADRLARVFVI